MSKQEQMIQSLWLWYVRQKRSLPWRSKPTLYRVWVSEIMLQQTTVAAVVPYFVNFMKKFPTVKKLAEAHEQDVLKAWAGLGYYSRARNLHKAARMMVLEKKFPKTFPQTKEQWLEVPGVGPYTAGAITSIALNHPEPILDGNVERVLARMNKLEMSSEYKKNLWALSDQAVKRAYSLGILPGDFNQALMELGATVCTPKNPSCHECPIQKNCQAFKKQQVALYPPRKKPKEWIHLKETAYYIQDARGRFMLEQQKAGNWRAGLWDFPQNLSENFKKTLQFVGQTQTKYVVTRHKVTRFTRIYLLKSWKAAEGLSAGHYQWVKSEKDVPSGSALKRTLSSIRGHFPEVAPKMSEPEEA